MIQKGRILAVGEPAALKNGSGSASVWVRLRAVAPVLVEAAAGVPGIRVVEPRGDGLRLQMTHPENETPAAVRALVLAGAEILAVQPEGRSLEEVYLELVREGAENGATGADLPEGS